MDLVKCIGMKIHIIKGSGGKVSSGDMGKYGRMMFYSVKVYSNKAS